MPSSQNVWLVTGASSGLGAAIAISALQAGHKVVACARKPEKAANEVPEIEALGGTWLKLDVSSKQTQETVHKAIESIGRIDVVVNNAGYIMLGAMEDLSEEEIYEQMNTNFFGQLRVLRGVLPQMRAQCHGTIITMSSVFGYSPYPAASMYTASKHALEGMSASLALEVAKYNIRVALVEPGLFRTNVVNHMQRPTTRISEAYKGTCVQQAQALADYITLNPQRMPGDPAKLGDRVVEFVDGQGMCEGVAKKGLFRLMLGQETMDAWKKQLKSLQENVAAMEEVALSTKFDEVAAAALTNGAGASVNTTIGAVNGAAKGAVL